MRYCVAGAFGLLAGLSLTAINTASDYNAGGAYTLLSVAAVVIGGCSLAGGLISPLGVVAGSVTLSLIGALLGMLNVSPDFNAAVQGVAAPDDPRAEDRRQSSEPRGMKRILAPAGLDRAQPLDLVAARRRSSCGRCSRR